MATLSNLTGQSAGTVLTTAQISLFLDNGAYSDYTVRQGVITGMSNGTALTGSGGEITPSVDETVDVETRTPDNQTAPTVTGQAGGSHDTGVSEATSQNIVRFDGAALKVNHSVGDTVLYICVRTSAGDIVGKYVS
jgi:hypothetical protein